MIKSLIVLCFFCSVFVNIRTPQWINVPRSFLGPTRLCLKDIRELFWEMLKSNSNISGVVETFTLGMGQNI